MPPWFVVVLGVAGRVACGELCGLFVFDYLCFVSQSPDVCGGPFGLYFAFVLLPIFAGCTVHYYGVFHGSFPSCFGVVVWALACRPCIIVKLFLDSLIISRYILIVNTISIIISRYILTVIACNIICAFVYSMPATDRRKRRGRGICIAD